MNRSLTNVIFGGIAPTAIADDSTKGLSVTRTNVDEVVDILTNAENVIIVPGYGELRSKRLAYVRYGRCESPILYKRDGVRPSSARYQVPIRDSSCSRSNAGSM